MNTTYLEKLNKKGSKINKIFFKMIKLFSSKPDVIQIGIGGYSSSGKTVLIDALFSIFDTNAVPQYMPKNHAGVFLDASEYLPAYSNHSDLRAHVSNYFHQDHATIDEGKWNENTHCAKLHFSGKKKIILIRNIPGEMFSVYCQQMGNENKSLKTRFKEFISANKGYKKTIKKLFKFQISPKNLEHKSIIETALNEIKDAFFQYINLTNYTPADAIPKIEKNFFAFLFYFTADINVYCIKSKDLTEEEIKVANDNINNSFSSENDISNFIVCYTQFDRILSVKKLPDIAPEHIPNDENSGSKFLKLLGVKKQANSSSNGTANEITNYWLTMNKFYEDVEKSEHKMIAQNDWNSIKSITGNGRYNWFYTSVAYNFNQNKFLDFQNQTAAALDTWKIENNNERTPIGVLEMLLYILRRNGFKENNWKLALPNDIKFSTIRKKIGIE